MPIESPTARNGFSPVHSPTDRFGDTFEPVMAALNGTDQSVKFTDEMIPSSSIVTIIMVLRIPVLPTVSSYLFGCPGLDCLLNSIGGLTVSSTDGALPLFINNQVTTLTADEDIHCLWVYLNHNTGVMNVYYDDVLITYGTVFNNTPPRECLLGGPGYIAAFTDGLKRSEIDLGPMFISTEGIDPAVKANRDRVFRRINGVNTFKEPGYGGARWSPTGSRGVFFVRDFVNDFYANEGTYGEPEKFAKLLWYPKFSETNLDTGVIPDGSMYANDGLLVCANDGIPSQSSCGDWSSFTGNHAGAFKGISGGLSVLDGWMADWNVTDNATELDTNTKDVILAGKFTTNTTADAAGVGAGAEDDDLGQRWNGNLSGGSWVSEGLSLAGFGSIGLDAGLMISQNFTSGSMFANNPSGAYLMKQGSTNIMSTGFFPSEGTPRSRGTLSYCDVNNVMQLVSQDDTTGVPAAVHCTLDAGPVGDNDMHAGLRTRPGHQSKQWHWGMLWEVDATTDDVDAIMDDICQNGKVVPDLCQHHQPINGPFAEA